MVARVRPGVSRGHAAPEQTQKKQRISAEQKALESLLHLPEETAAHGWYLPPKAHGLRTPLADGEKFTSQGVQSLHDARFQTALYFSAAMANMASISNAGAIILYLSGASCAHSRATAMLTPLKLFTKPGYPGVAIDHAFHGDGPHDDAFLDLPTYMAWIHRLVEVLRREHGNLPIGIFGRSTGANLALEYAARYPGDAASILAMSGYNPAWTPYSLYHIEQMRKSGEFELNEPGLAWVEALDEQWTWHLPSVRERMVQNKALILVGDRDGEYPWHPWQVEGEFARGYMELPLDRELTYISWWKTFAPLIGASLSVIPGGEHNLFNPHEKGVFQEAKRIVSAFFEEALPLPGREFLGSSPFLLPKELLSLSRDFSILTEETERLHERVGSHERNLSGLIELSLRYALLSQHSDASETFAREAAGRSRVFGEKARRGMREKVALLLMGQPVSGALMQVAAQEILLKDEPRELLPRTRSFRNFAELVSKALQGGVPTVVTGTLSDALQRPLTVRAQIRRGRLQLISLEGDAEVLSALKTNWQQNDAILARQDSERDGLSDATRGGMRLEEQGNRMVLRREIGADLSDELFLARCAECFFAYWPHPLVQRFVRRLDADQVDRKDSSAEAFQPILPVVHEKDRVVVKGEVQDVPAEASPLTRFDVERLRAHQRRAANAPFFQRRRDPEAEPDGAFRVERVQPREPRTHAPLISPGVQQVTPYGMRFISWSSSYGQVPETHRVPIMHAPVIAPVTAGSPVNIALAAMPSLLFRVRS